MKYQNDRGNPVTMLRHIEGRNRYHYDFEACTPADGWKQYDTDQDAHYFGVWIHLERREILTYAEGDEIRTTCPTPETFRAELDHMAQFYGPPPPYAVAIDHDGTVTHYVQERD